MKKSLRLLLSIGLSLILLAYFFEYAEFCEVVALLKKVDGMLLFICFFFYSALSVLRSFRIKILIHKKLSINQIIPILLKYNVLNFVMPFRLGELTYLYFMKRTRKVSVHLALASLAYIRVIDILYLFILFCVCIFFAKNVSGDILHYRVAGIFFGSFALLVALVLLFCNAIIRNLLNKLLHSLGRTLPIKKLSDFITRTLDNIDSYRTEGTLMASNLLTLFIWILIFGFYYSLALSIKTELSFFDFSLVVLLINLTALLPIQGVAGVGTFEGAVILGMTNFGIPLTTAIPFSLSLHILYICYFVTFGIIGVMIGIFDSET